MDISLVFEFQQNPSTVYFCKGSALSKRQNCNNEVLFISLL